MRGLGEDVIRRYLDELGESPVVRNAENTVLLARHPRVISPVQRRVYNYLSPFVRSLGTVPPGDNLSGTIGARNPGQDVRGDARILPLGGEKIPAVERRRPEPDHGLTRSGLRLRHVLINELVRTLEFVQSNSFHVAPFGRSTCQHAALQAACQVVSLVRMRAPRFHARGSLATPALLPG